MTKNIPLEEIQKIILAENREQAILEMAQRYATTFVNILKQLKDLLGDEQYQIYIGTAINRNLNEEKIIQFNPVEFYSKYINKITCAYLENVFQDGKGNYRCNAKRTEEREKYLFKGLSDNVVLIECPKDILAMEFETHNNKSKEEFKEVTKDKIKEWIKETTKIIKEKGFNYCVCDHGGTSPWIYVCNINGLVENFEKDCKEELARLFVPEEAFDFIDRSNFGATLIPIIERPHWKSKKYNNAIHKIVDGISPEHHKNEFPSNLSEEIMSINRPRETVSYDKFDSETNVNDISITSIVNMSGLKKRGHEYQGSNPWHSSSTGMNFTLDPFKNRGFCFRCLTSPDSSIFTPEGIKKIIDIKEGDSVFGKENNIVSVSKTFRNRYSGKIYLFKCGVPDVKFTAEHPLLVCSINGERPSRSKKKIQWKECKDITNKDYIVIPKRSIKKTLDNLDGGLKLTKDLGYLIGKYIADGHLYHNTKRKYFLKKEKRFTEHKQDNYRITITINHKKIEQAKKILKIAKELFNASGNFWVSEKRGVCIITILSKHLFLLLEKEIGKGSANKRLGIFVNSIPEFRDSLIDSYIENDGCCIPKTKQQRVSSVSEVLIKEVQDCLFQRGVFARYCKINEHLTNPYAKNPKHLLQWQVSPQNKSYFEDENYFYAKIKKIIIEEVKDIEVYNFETSDNTYRVPFVVHNCNVGINPAQAIALNEGVISSCDSKMSRDQFIQVLDIAVQKYGLKRRTPVAIICDSPSCMLEPQKEKIDFEQMRDSIRAINSDEDLEAPEKRRRICEMIAQNLQRGYYIYSIKEDKGDNEVWIYREGIYVPNGKSELKQIMRHILQSGYTENYVKDILARIEVDTYIDANDFFNRKYLDYVPLQNGVLNLLTLQLASHDPEMIFFNKLPVSYDPNAKCPAIEKHLQEVLKYPEDKDLFFEIAGYCLWKDYNIERAIMMVGDGRNGKGKTIELIKRFLGMNNCASVSLTSMKEGSFSLSNLFGKMVNLAGDLSSTSLKETGLFKQTTGRDLIGANRKYLTDIQFTNFAKHIFGCNELPMIFDNSKGFWERWIILEFPYTFIPQKEYDSLKPEEKINKKIMDIDLIEKITTPEELNGLMIKALNGLHNLLERKDFCRTQGSEEVKRLWIRKANSFMAFCLDFLEEDYENKITKIDMRKVFSEYCRLHKIRGSSDIMIKNTLQEMYGASEEYESLYKDGDRKYVWRGVAFKKNSSYAKYNYQSWKDTLSSK